MPPESTFKPLQNATVHCVVYGRVMQGKQTGMGSCHWTDAAGDTFIGESVDAPDKPGVWTFLSGTGKYNGVTGGGSYSTTAAGRDGLGRHDGDVLLADGQVELVPGTSEAAVVRRPDRRGGRYR